MLVPHHLECVICGARSVTVQDRFQLTASERQALDEFMIEHQECVKSRPGFAVEHVIATMPDGYTPAMCGPFGPDRPEPRSMPHPHGYFEYTGPYGEIQQGDTISCCHCRRHIEYRAGIENQLGFCSLCYNGKTGSGKTCGHTDCAAHVPFEQRLENWEAGLPALTPRRPQTSVPANFAGAVILESPPAEKLFAIDTTEI